MPQWTRDQQNAIDADSRNIIVSAAAGSGKTAVLVERTIRIITDEKNPADIDKLLVVTFTNAAAAEMKARISARLEELLRLSPGKSLYMRQLALLPSAKICTIDSFCLSLARENFFTLGISQDFTVLDDSEAQIIAAAALDTALDAFYNEGDPDFLLLAETLSSPKDDAALAQAVKKTYEYISAQPLPLEWLEKMISLHAPGVPFEESVWYAPLISFVRDRLDYSLRLINECISLVDDQDETAQKYFDVLNYDLATVTGLLSALENGWDFAAQALKKVSFPVLRGNGKNKYEPPFKAEITGRRDLYKDIIKSAAEFSSLSGSAFEEDNDKIYPVLKTLYRVTEEFSREYRRLKDERNAYTFSDVEHFALELLSDTDESGALVPSAAAKELQSTFKEILVDEYQDTNEAQDALFRLLSNGNNRFMVGDVKQSIYRFRLAMPYIFNQKRESYKDYEKSTPGESARIILGKNFRSRKEICDFVNFLFKKIMSEKAGELDYSEREYLNSCAQYPQRTQPCIYIKAADGVKSPQADETEGHTIARIILDKINAREQVSEKGVQRDIRFGDFAVLLRSSKNHIANYSETLASYGIPAVCDSSSNLLDCQEIKMLVSLLRVIDNPTRDIPLLAAMMSPLYGFTADEMADIRTENSLPGRSLYTCVVTSRSEKAMAFIKDIKALSETAVTMPTASFIRFLCEYKSVFAFANALGNGEQRCANINSFISFASRFDSFGSADLTSFIRLVNRIEENGGSVDSPALSASGENAVSIMSIHHSKGLEFPVVILAGTERKYNYDDLKGRLLFNPKYGVSVKRHNEELLYQTDTAQHAVLKSLNKNAALSENLRVLYVALTRAKEQLIALVTAENLESKINKLACRIANGSMDPVVCRDIPCDGDFLLAAAMLHRDGGKLRELSNINVAFESPGFAVDVEITQPQPSKRAQSEIVPAQADAKLAELFAKRLAYKYPGSKLNAVCAKLNASELDSTEHRNEFFASSKPAFMNKGGLTPGQRGSAMHAFMQFCDYKASQKNLECEISRLEENGFLTAEQAASLNRDALNKFFNGAFAERMFASDKIYREIKISSFVPVSELYGISGEEKVLVRGISDCVFEENGSLILVDYKTDKVKTEEELLERYKNQIAFYCRAVSKTLKKPVKRAVLYSFHLSKVCEYRKI